jgi:hypothetical protein
MLMQKKNTTKKTTVVIKKNPMGTPFLHTLKTTTDAR